MASPEVPPPLNGEQELVDQALGWLETNVVKLIATKLVPLVVTSGVVVSTLAWLQKELGLNLPSEVVAVAVGTAMFAVAGMAFEYIRNHGRGAAQVTVKALEVVQKHNERSRGLLEEGDWTTPPR
jgi:hypothetical protein